MSEPLKEYGVLEAVPEKDRTYGFMDMLATWTAANANNGTWYTGGVVAASTFAGALVVTFVANPIAYIIMACIGYMGFKVGATSMGLTRPSFGIRGSMLPSILNATQFIGWTAVNTYIAAISISFILKELLGWPAFGEPGSKWVLVVGIVIMSVLHLLTIVWGHHSVKLVERIGVIALLILGLWETAVVVKSVPLDQLFAWRPPHVLPMGSAMDIMAAFSLGWVPAIAEFTRYTKDKKSAILAPMIGANLSLFWFALVGIVGVIGSAIITGTYDPNASDPSSLVSKLGLGILALLVIVIISTTANAINLMASGMSINNMFPKVKPISALLLVAIIAGVLTLVPVFWTSFVSAFILFLDYVGMIFAPLFAVMIIDFFYIKKKKYDWSQADRKDGIYWYTNGVNWAGVGTWIFGVLVFLFFKKIGIFTSSVGAIYPTMIVAGIVYAIVGKYSLSAKPNTNINS
jgi:NCS1 family nucleobase:cation symporter-1